jgi:hypothetical protein
VQRPLPNVTHRKHGGSPRLAVALVFLSIDGDLELHRQGALTGDYDRRHERD